MTATLDQRLLMLALMRVLVALTVVVTYVTGAEPVRGTVIACAIVYVCFTGLVEYSRRLLKIEKPVVTKALLLVDGVFLQWVVVLSGVWAREVVYLPLVPVVAVTLLLSVRAGVKLALWQCVLSVGFVALGKGGVIDSPVAADRVVLLGDIALLMTAAVAAKFSSINETELRWRRAHVALMSDFGTRLQDATSVDDATNGLVETVKEQFDCPRAAVLSQHDSESLGELLPDEKYVLLGTSVEGGPAVDAALPGALNVVLVPIRMSGDLLGTLLVEWGPGRPGIRRSTASLLVSYAERAAITIRTLQLAVEMRRMAAIDSLTGLVNRASFDKALSLELGRARRTHQPLALVLLDIDDFKEVNDEHGRAAGDDVMRATGRVLRQMCRYYDIVARVGDEEVAVLMPGCAPEHAYAVAERYRKAIATSGSEVPVTASAGIACMRPGVDVPDALYKAADEALHQAKEAGQDQAVMAEG